MGSIIYSSNMNIFCLYLSLILAVTTAQKNGGQLPPPPPPGLCLDPRMMSAVCTINTEIGSRMEQAHLQCAAAAQVQVRKEKERSVMWIWTLLMSSLLMSGRRRLVFSGRLVGYHKKAKLHLTTSWLGLLLLIQD